MTAKERVSDGIPYIYEQKSVRNLNLRVTPAGQVHLSVPRGVGVREADRFVAEHRGWILSSLEQFRRRAETRREESQTLPSPEEALKIFAEVSEQYYPLFAAVLGGQRPALKVRDMKSRWGVCYPRRRQITLNLRLALRPRPQIEYVVLHEYCHFVHPDHQAGFWALMSRFMPDWRQRRSGLKAPLSPSEEGEDDLG